MVLAPLVEGVGRVDYREPNALTSVQCLLLHAGKLRCGVPISGVIEVMRCQPVVAISNLPRFVMGVSIIRGDRVPVVDLCELLGAAGEQTGRTRLVTVRVGSRVVALAVDSVTGIREFERNLLANVPPLLACAHPEALAAIGLLDRELLMVLDESRMVPDEILAEMSDR